MSSFIASSGLLADLHKRAELHRPIHLGVVGCGEMGTDLLSAVAHMTGLRIVAVADRRPERVQHAAHLAYGHDDHVQIVSSFCSLQQIIENQKIAATPYFEDLIHCPLIDIIIDATGNPNAGAEIGIKTIENGKHLVMMNVEADVTIGSYLKAQADKAGVIYSLGAGDEPSACMELIRFVTAMGHPIIAAGKGKNNPLNIDATPDLYAEEAQKRHMNPHMLVEFVDGSKTMVEMAAIANATGLRPDCPGMHGQSIPLSQLAHTLIPQTDGGILSKRGVVDYSISPDIAPGVFVTTEIRHPRIRERLCDLKMGNGPYFTFYRPYHLTSLEVPLTCARIMLYGQADMTPLSRPVVEVCAVAKTDLAVGERLDSIGGYHYRAWIMPIEAAQKAKAHPCGLLKDARVLTPIKKGEILTKNNIAIDDQSYIARLRHLQDQLLMKDLV